jgi:hypothetical protein
MCRTFVGVRDQCARNGFTAWALGEISQLGRACAAALVSDEVRQALEQRNAAVAEADEVPPMSWAERRKHSATIAEILEVLKPLLA